MCFTTLNTSDHDKSSDEPLRARLTFELTVIKMEKKTTDKLGQMLSGVDTTVSKIQAEYRNVRTKEQQLQATMRSARVRMWLMFLAELVCIALAVFSQMLYITRLGKKV